jgi:hypothetical protein
VYFNLWPAVRAWKGQNKPGCDSQRWYLTILADGNESYISNLFPKQQRLAALARLEIAKVFFGAFMLFQARLLGCATAAVNKSASYHSFYKQLFIIRSVALAE